MAEGTDVPKAGDQELGVSGQLAGQHSIHGVFGRIYDRLGGEDWLFEWAQDHETTFVKMLVGMTPSMHPVSGIQGDVHLHLHASLQPTALDGAVEGDYVDVTPAGGKVESGRDAPRDAPGDG